MLHEFAVDPNSMSTWERVRYIIEKFGVETGRMISRFPKGWQGMVYRSCMGCSEIDKQRIEIKLFGIGSKLFRSRRAYDPSVSWLENAEKQHMELPFHAIISDRNPKNHEKVLSIDELHDKTPGFDVPRQVFVRRHPADLAKCVSSLFNNSKEILFVDPHFNPSVRRYQETLQHFLREASRNGRNFSRIEYHLKQVSTRQCFEKDCHDRLKTHLPQGVSVKFIRWKDRPGGKKLHPRYILTDLGGIHVDYGLDAGFDGGQSNETTQVTLMDSNAFAEVWNDFQTPEYQESQKLSTFEYCDELVVIGSMTT